MKKLLSLSLLSTLFIIFAAARFVNPVEELIQSLQEYRTSSPKEITWLHVNKPSFYKGDDVHFTAYLLDADSKQRSTASNLFYAKLLDESGEVIAENVYPVRDGIVVGDFQLPVNNESETFTIVAFSSLMKAYGEDEYFTTDIKLNRISDSGSIINLAFDKPNYELSDTLNAYIEVADQSGNTMAETSFKWYLDWESGSAEGEISTNEIGSVNLSIPLEIVSSDVEQLNFSLSEDSESGLTKSWSINIGSEAMKMDFYPEGGLFIINQRNRIAFKSYDLVGSAISVKGSIVDSNSDTVARINTLHEGMGSFYLTPVEGVTYKAVVRDENGNIQSFDLPDALQSGSRINVIPRDSSLVVTLQNSPAEEVKNLNLVFTFGREILWYNTIPVQGQVRFNLPTTNLPSGVGKLTLFNDDALPIAERLVFINHGKKLQISIELDSADEFRPEGSVKAELSVKDHLGRPIDADLSLSIYDKKQVSENGWTGIQAGLLLNQDIRGEVPTPDYYFNSDEANASRALDLVMLTHGWTKFNWDDIKTKSWSEPSPDALTDKITGLILDQNDKPVKNLELSLLATSGAFGFYKAVSNDEGHFRFEDAPIPVDSVEYRFATSKEGTYNIQFFNDTESALSVDYKNQLTREEDRSIRMSNEITYTDLDQIQDLGAITVTATKRSEAAQQFVELQRKENVVAETKTRDELMRMGAGSGGTIESGTTEFVEILKRVTAVYRYDNQTGKVFFSAPSSITRPQGALFIVNGNRFGYDVRTLNFLKPSEIEKINVYKRGSGGLYAFDAEGVVEIITVEQNNADLVKNQLADDSLIQNSVFFTQVKTFYEPTPAEREATDYIDYRSAVYWSPQLRIRNGEPMDISFFLNSSETEYIIRAEGIGSNSLLGSSQLTFETKGENK